MHDHWFDDMYKNVITVRNPVHAWIGATNIIRDGDTDFINGRAGITGAQDPCENSQKKTLPTHVYMHLPWFMKPYCVYT